MDVGKRINKLRNDKGWSLRELENRTGINYSVLSRIESGKRSLTDQEINVFSDLFGVTTDYLLGRTDNPQGYISIAYDGGFDFEDEDEKEHMEEELKRYREMKARMKAMLAKEKKGNN